MVEIVENVGGTVASTKQFVWESGSMRESRDSSGALISQFFDGGQTIDGTDYFYTKDHLGSIREMTDDSENIQAQYVYDPYGRAMQIQGSLASDFQYARYYCHASSGLDFAVHRAYNANLDRLANNLSMTEQVVMPGYPLAIFDDVNHFPIFRRGMTASHAAVDFKNRAIGAVDIACHPGSSGSPIYILNETGLPHPKTKVVVGAKKPILLGVLSEGAVYSAGTVKMTRLPTSDADEYDGLPINLGYYVKAREVKFLGELAVERFVGHSAHFPRNREEADLLALAQTFT